MGGLLSTRWGMHRKKVTVEACRVLDVNQLTRLKLLQAHLRQAGAWTWVDASHVPVAALGYQLDTTNMVFPTLTLSYTVLPSQTHVQYMIPLATTRVHRGGTRWWVCCPLVNSGEVCHRRCEKLYLPPGQLYFGCRQCYDLTYKSCQLSHTYDTLAKAMGLTPAEVRRQVSGTR